MFLDMEEIWKDVNEYEGLYQVSNLGRIKSLEGKKIVFLKHLSKEKILIVKKNRCGYLYVGLSKDLKRKSYTIHRLIAKAFIQNPDNKLTVNHINGIKTDNRVENLEWNTSTENVYHKNNILGKHCRGENSGMSKLTEKDVLEIRSKYIPYKYSTTKLGEEYNVHNSTICSIINNKIWKHI